MLKVCTSKARLGGEISYSDSNRQKDFWTSLDLSSSRFHSTANRASNRVSAANRTANPASISITTHAVANN